MFLVAVVAVVENHVVQKKNIKRNIGVLYSYHRHARIDLVVNRRKANTYTVSIELHQPILQNRPKQQNHYQKEASMTNASTRESSTSITTTKPSTKTTTFCSLNADLIRRRMRQQIIAFLLGKY